jgi:hypothetical protein
VRVLIVLGLLNLILPLLGLSVVQEDLATSLHISVDLFLSLLLRLHGCNFSILVLLDHSVSVTELSLDLGL